MTVEIRIITEKYQNAVFELQKCALKEMGNGWYHCPPKKIIQAALQQGRSVACFHDNVMIGMRLNCTSKIPVEFLYRLPISNRRDQGAYLCGVYINPAYRGANLSKRMTALTLDILKKDDIKHSYTTVHPRNIPNIRSLKANGFSIVYQGLFYAGKPRVLLYRKNV